MFENIKKKLKSRKGNSLLEFLQMRCNLLTTTQSLDKLAGAKEKKDYR